MKQINIIFPHQLFKDSPLLLNQHPTYLVEEFLFFNQYKFHKQKIAFHRATMKKYADFLQTQKSSEVVYINSFEATSDIRILIPELKKMGVQQVNYIDPTDNWLQKRLDKGLQLTNIKSKQYTSPLFLNAKDDILPFFNQNKKKYNQTSFYIEQRKSRKIMLQSNGKPLGNKWTFDTENRKKYPAKKVPPSIHLPNKSFQRVDGHIIFISIFDALFNDLMRRQKSGV